MAVSLDQMETAWLREAPRAIAEVVRSSSAEIFYGAAFWLFYCDYSQILTPALGLNSESFVTYHEDQGEGWSDRWVPAEWHWPVLDQACDAMKPAYARISESMEGCLASRMACVDIRTRSDDCTRPPATSRGRARAEGETSPVSELQSILWSLPSTINEKKEEYNALVRASVSSNRLEQIKGLIRE